MCCIQAGIYASSPFPGTIPWLMAMNSYSHMLNTILLRGWSPPVNPPSLNPPLISRSSHQGRAGFDHMGREENFRAQSVKETEVSLSHWPWAHPTAHHHDLPLMVTRDMWVKLVQGQWPCQPPAASPERSPLSKNTGARPASQGGGPTSPHTSNDGW